MRATVTETQVEETGRRLAVEPDVVAVYLFGSRAGGRPHALSDVDIGVLLRAGYRGNRLLELMGIVQSCLKTDHYDVVIVNEAPLPLAFRIACRGRLIACTDDRARTVFTASLADRYIDSAPMREIFYRGMLARIEKGTFGRP